MINSPKWKKLLRLTLAPPSQTATENAMPRTYPTKSCKISRHSAKQRRKKPMGLYTIKPRFQKLINNLVNLSLRYHLQPDFYTYGACLASLFALISIWVGLKLNPFFLLLVFLFCCVRI